MQNDLVAGRQARQPQSHLSPNEPRRVHAWLVTPCRPPDLPRSARCVGLLRVPLTLRLRPWARLYRLDDGTLRWAVRLPGPFGDPVWATLEEEVPLRWARDSGLPSLERELRSLLEAARSATSEGPAPSGEVA